MPGSNYPMLQMENPINRKIPVLKIMACPTSFFLSFPKKDKPITS
jgi:hypothetical protein